MSEEKEVTLSLRHEAFCRELVKDWNEMQAYHRAYGNKNMKTCANNASRLLVRDDIKKRVRQIKEERNQESLVDVKYVTDKAKFIIDTDFTEVMEMGVRGCTRTELEKLPIELRRLITQIKVTTTSQGRGADKIETDKIIFKMMSKDKAHDILAKHTGTYNDSIANINIGLGSLAETLKDANEKASKKND